MGYMKQFSKSYFDIVKLYGIVAIGAAGAPTITNFPGVSSVTRTGVGAYDIVYTDTFSLFLMLSAVLEVAGPEALVVQVTAKNLSTKTISILCVDTAGVVADPSNGSVLRLEMTFSESSAYPNNG